MTGEFKGATVTIDGKLLATFEIHEKDYFSKNDYSGLLDIIVKKHRKKRSLNANSYFHSLLSQMAKKQGTSMTFMKNKMILEYGQFDYESTGNISHVIMLDSIDHMEIEYMHLAPTHNTKIMDNGKLYRVFLIMRGSHTYDTAEMSELIAGTVREAKEMGVETISKEELERLLECWKVSKDGRYKVDKD